MEKKAKVAILASGRGSNAAALISFAKNPGCSYHVELILSNKRSAKVLDLAKESGIEHDHFARSSFYEDLTVIKTLKQHEIDLVVLAGFLWLVPSAIINHFPNRIINIHPALLPKYGGKGMYGMNIHKAVKENNEKESGITIHFVNEKYDDGAIIFQASCPLSEEDTPANIAEKVLRLEHHFYPRIVNGVAGRI